jgi:pyridoxine 5-phosphate synthase
MTQLSVNINKIATIRNARGGNLPDLLKAAADIEKFGAHGITVHPRPDERHIRYQDVRDLKKVVQTELNVEGNPTDSFLDLVMDVLPHQVTLVPDAPDAITSSAGWDTEKHFDFLFPIIDQLKRKGIRTSIFIDPIAGKIKKASDLQTDRIELYTEFYAQHFSVHPMDAIKEYKKAAELAHQLGLGVNAGHDLNLENLKFFHQQIQHLAEVSIGHALISDALYLGLDNTVKMYLHQLQNEL